LGSARDDIVVLDGDLSADCGVRPFENSFPKRFIENGIAEQDMVSMAGGLALQGFLPIVNSFGVFLASRANEQIYNNATENTKIIYVCHYAGIIPAGPGKSHQSVRDISLLGALPNFSILEPCNGLETKQALEWCVKEAETNCMIRLVISPSPRSIRLPENYKLSLGKGAILSEGSGAVLFAYGPVLLNEALLASEGLKEKNVNLKVINFPWINRINMDWLEDTIGDSDTIFVMDNHSTSGGLGDFLLNSMMSSDTLRTKRLIKYAIEEFPACGTPKEVLAYHKLDGNSLITRILGAMS
jgi:transketolase